MSRPRVLFLLAIGLLLGVHPMFAANYAVGTCKPSLPSYATISAAVSGVPPGSTVLVCPGTYPEQVTIAQPLTLQGITSGNAGQAVITVPGSGLTVVTSGVGYSIAPQVHVTAGPVNISDITVDGTGNNVTYPTWLVGILYDSGSSGTVNEITARNLSASGAGVGVWAENATATNESVTIENSSFHDIDNSAVLTIVTFGNNTLLATVKGNSMETAGTQVQWNAAGSLTGNVVNGGIEGIALGGSSSATTVSGNTVANSAYGIVAFVAGVSVTSNKISNASTGIYFCCSSGGTFQSNTITKAGIGIQFNCSTATVLHNTINDATTGIDRVPVSFSGANNFDNVVTLRTSGCAAARSRGPELPTAHSGPVRAPSH
jgi:parallel beta-helix repeat protein